MAKRRWLNGAAPGGSIPIGGMPGMPGMPDMNGGREICAAGFGGIAGFSSTFGFFAAASPSVSVVLANRWVEVKHSAQNGASSRNADLAAKWTCAERRLRGV